MIETRRSVLEPVGAEHVEGLIEAISTSLEELRPWMAWVADWNPEDSRTYMLQRSGNDHLHAVMLDGKPIGVCNVLVAKPLLGTGELGYWMSTAHAGQGFMTEALDGLITWSFEELKLHRLELRAGVDNVASNRVAEKLGFRNCGRMREAARGADGYYDCNLWELVVGDPRPVLT